MFETQKKKSEKLQQRSETLEIVDVKETEDDDKPIRDGFLSLRPLSNVGTMYNLAEPPSILVTPESQFSHMYLHTLSRIVPWHICTSTLCHVS